MEPKAKTMQERFGFSDPDLKTPKHDAIMMWLDGEIDRIANERPEHKRAWNIHAWFENRYQESEHGPAAKIMLDDMRDEIIKSVGMGLAPLPKIVKVWEKPIVSERFNRGVVDKSFTIGFADMLVSCSLPYISCKFSPYPLTLLNSEVGYSDSWRAYFEVKPSIPSVGELIRQLRMYQTYTGHTEWFVVSPDDRCESILKAQGFGFIKVPALP